MELSAASNATKYPNSEVYHCRSFLSKMALGGGIATRPTETHSERLWGSGEPAAQDAAPRTERRCLGSPPAAAAREPAAPGARAGGRHGAAHQPRMHPTYQTYVNVQGHGRCYRPGKHLVWVNEGTCLVEASGLPHVCCTRAVSGSRRARAPNTRWRACAWLWNPAITLLAPALPCPPGCPTAATRKHANWHSPPTCRRIPRTGDPCVPRPPHRQSMIARPPPRRHRIKAHWRRPGSKLWIRSNCQAMFLSLSACSNRDSARSSRDSARSKRNCRAINASVLSSLNLNEPARLLGLCRPLAFFTCTDSSLAWVAAAASPHVLPICEWGDPQ